MPPNVGSGRIEIAQNADTGTSITIFEGAGQLSGGTPPFRVFDPNGNLVYSLGVAGGASSGGAATAVAVKTTTYTMVAGDSMILANATGGAFTITLPPANIATPFSRQAYIVKTDTSANAVTIAAAGADTIQGLATIQLQTLNASVILYSDGISKWVVLPGTFAADNMSLKSVTTTYTILQTDYKILASDAGGSFTITLPAANSVPAGWETRVEKTNNSANTVTVSRAGADTIEGANTVALAAQFSSVRLTSDGVGVWYKF